LRQVQVVPRGFALAGRKVFAEVETRALVQTVKRNIDRFPEDFMFQLSEGEYANLKSQIVTSSWGGARRATPYHHARLRPDARTAGQPQRPGTQN
jgi:hypothetical protein